MFTAFKRLLFGNPLKTHQVVHERLTKKPALAVFSSDALPYHLENKIVGASPRGRPALKALEAAPYLSSSIPAPGVQRDTQTPLYDFFINSLRHPYTPARTLRWLIICRPKLAARCETSG